jgi:AsmA protein
LSVRVGAASLANPAGFEGASLLSVKQANIGARLLPLLDGRLELDRIRLDGLDVQLHRLADGRANWDGLGATAAKSRSTRRAAGRSPAWADSSCATARSR